MPEDTTTGQPPRRRGAPKGNLNAYKYGVHSAGLHVDDSALPPDMRAAFRAAIALAIRAEVAALPRPHTTEQRRRATIAGLRRVFACLGTVDWRRPRPDSQVRLEFLLALQPVLRPTLHTTEARKIQKDKEQIEAESGSAPDCPFVFRLGDQSE
jgi:hypothetical protein